MSVGLIYCVLNTVNGKRYIGQTTQTCAKRWHQHCADARTRTYPLHCAIRKHGAAAFDVFEIYHAVSQDELNQMEAELIAGHQSADRKYGYNVRAGGDSGGKLSAETRRKIGDRHRGRTAHNKGKRLPEAQRAALIERMKNHHPCKGRAMSPETKAKIGAANHVHMLGRKQSEETKQKHSDAMFRRFATAESRAQHSERLKGRVCSEETRRKIRDAQVGREVPLEHREKLRLAQLGKKQSPESSAKKSLAMAQIWKARKEAAKCL